MNRVMWLRTAGACLVLASISGCETRGGLFITTPQSTVASLSGLQVSAGTLTPQFGAETVAYTVAVPNTTAQIVVRPTATSTSAVITVNGAIVTSGGESPPQALNVGANTIPVSVRAPTGATRTYTITVNRAAP